MKLKLIVCVDNQNGIGLNNTLPWRCKNDLKQFKALTIGDNNNNAIIMGKNTWESLPKKPLPNRLNIVLSKKYNCLTNKDFPYTYFCNSLEQVFQLHQIKNNELEECWIIGGESIYKQFINDKRVNNLYITHIDNSYNCDTFFPKIPPNFSLKAERNIQLENPKAILKIYKNANL